MILFAAILEVKRDQAGPGNFGGFERVFVRDNVHNDGLG
jgi:hypothetical protein